MSEINHFLLKLLLIMMFQWTSLVLSYSHLSFGFGKLFQSTAPDTGGWSWRPSCLSAEVILNYHDALLYFVLSLPLLLELSCFPPLLSIFCLWSSSTPVMLSAHFLAVPTQRKQVL